MQLIAKVQTAAMSLVERLARLEAQMAETKAEMAATKTEMAATKAEMAATKTEMAETKTEMAETKTEMAETKAEMAAQMAAINAQMAATKAEMDNAFSDSAPLRVICAMQYATGDGSARTAASLGLVDCFARRCHAAHCGALSADRVRALNDLLRICALREEWVDGAVRNFLTGFCAVLGAVTSEEYMTRRTSLALSRRVGVWARCQDLLVATRAAAAAAAAAAGPAAAAAAAPPLPPPHWGGLPAGDSSRRGAGQRRGRGEVDGGSGAGAAEWRRKRRRR